MLPGPGDVRDGEHALRGPGTTTVLRGPVVFTAPDGRIDWCRFYQAPVVDV